MLARPVLDSWKAIAAHLGRTVRTVQRWERDAGLPVHRRRHGVLGSVHAYVDEIAEWLRRSTVASSATRVVPVPQPASVGIAVLPLPAAGSDADEGVAAMLGGGIVCGLAGIRGLRVVSSASSARIRLARADGAVDAAKAMHVAFLVDGALARIDGQVHASLQLVSTRDDRVQWSHVYLVSQQEVLAVSARIADDIARQMLTAAPAALDEPVAPHPGRVTVGSTTRARVLTARGRF